LARLRKEEAGGAADVSALADAAARLSAQGKYAAAEKRLLQAARSLRRANTEFRRERAAVWNELGMVCKYLGKFRSAQRYYQRALDSVGRLAGCDSLVADLYHNLGGLEHSRRRFKVAEKYARKGLRLRLQTQAGNSVVVASDSAALAAILDGLGKYDESERLYHQALKIYRKQFGADHAEIAVVLNNLGALHQNARRPARAAYYYRTALSMKLRVLSNSHPGLVPTLNNLATLCYSQNRMVEARLWFRRAVRLASVSLGPSHPVTRTLERSFGSISQQS
jgi:tetratricopeptide (TPR) repeat protein